MGAFEPAGCRERRERSSQKEEQEKLKKAEVEAFMTMKQDESGINMLESFNNSTDVQQDQSGTSLNKDNVV